MDYNEKHLEFISTKAVHTNAVVIGHITVHISKQIRIVMSLEVHVKAEYWHYKQTGTIA